MIMPAEMPVGSGAGDLRRIAERGVGAGPRMIGASGLLPGPLAGAGVRGGVLGAGVFGGADLAAGGVDAGRLAIKSVGTDRGDGVDGRTGAWLSELGEVVARLRRGISSADGGGIGVAVHGAERFDDGLRRLVAILRFLGHHLVEDGHQFRRHAPVGVRGWAWAAWSGPRAASA